MIEQHINQRQRVKEIMEETKKRLSIEIGKPVSLLYSIKVNHLSPQLIVQQVLSVCKITYSELVSKSQERKYVIPRYLAMWLLTYYCGQDQKEIGDLCGRERTVVSIGIKAINDALDVNDELVTIPLKEIEQRLLQITTAA